MKATSDDHGAPGQCDRAGLVSPPPWRSCRDQQEARNGFRMPYLWLHAHRFRSRRQPQARLSQLRFCLLSLSMPVLRMRHRQPRSHESAMPYLPRAKVPLRELRLCKEAARLIGHSSNGGRFVGAPTAPRMWATSAELPCVWSGRACLLAGWIFRAGAAAQPWARAARSRAASADRRQPAQFPVQAAAPAVEAGILLAREPPGGLVRAQSDRLWVLVVSGRRAK